MRRDFLTTEAIPIREMPLAEADRLFWLYSADRGLFRAIAKGAKKSSSRLGGHLDLLFRVRIELHEGAGIPTITGASIIDAHTGLRGDFEKTTAASALAERLRSLSTDDHPQPQHYAIFADALSFLDRASSLPIAAESIFSIALLARAGLLPDWRQCVLCGAPLINEKNAFDPDRAGVLCPLCRPFIGIEISFPIVKLVSFAARTPIAQSFSIAVSGEQKEEIDALAERLTAPYLRSFPKC